MGASAREIERQIKETRERMDQNITRLEGTAASGAVRYGRWAALGLGVIAVAGVAFLVYRRTRTPTLRERVDDVSVERIRELLERMKDELPSVTVRANEKSERQPGTVGRIVREVAPVLVGSVSTAVLRRSARSREPESR